MRNIILDLAVTLDGFIEGPNGEIDWCIMEEDMQFDKFLESIDSIFYGRASYDLWGNYIPAENAPDEEKKFWSTIHSKQKFVFSRHPKTDGRATFISTDIVKKVAEIKNQDGGDIWLYGGSSLISGFIKLALIDVYRISAHPVILGSGRPLFANVEERVDLQLMATKSFKSGVVQLIYKKGYS